MTERRMSSDEGAPGNPNYAPRPGERAAAGCDADTECLRVPCFQVQLDASRPRRAHRQANACAYHVPDVIGSLRAWAGEHGVADGHLTILAIEPAAGGRLPGQPGEAGQAGGPDQPGGFRGFAFSTIPLGSRAGAPAGPD